MDEVLDVVDVVADSGLDGIASTVLRAIGLVAIVVGFGMWLFTDMGMLVLPALLIVVGLILMAIPELLLGAVGLTG